MKLVFKCDYCHEIGTEEEIQKHEPNCLHNYDAKNCHTCIHKDKFSFENKQMKVICKKNIDVPVNNVICFCSSYERKEKTPTTELLDALFNSPFSNF